MLSRDIVFLTSGRQFPSVHGFVETLGECESGMYVSKVLIIKTNFLGKPDTRAEDMVPSASSPLVNAYSIIIHANQSGSGHVLFDDAPSLVPCHEATDNRKLPTTTTTTTTSANDTIVRTSQHACVIALSIHTTSLVRFDAVVMPMCFTTSFCPASV